LNAQYFFNVFSNISCTELLVILIALSFLFVRKVAKIVCFLGDFCSFQVLDKVLEMCSGDFWEGIVGLVLGDWQRKIIDIF